MAPAEISTKYKEVKFKVYPDHKGISQPWHCQKKPTLTPRPKFSGACKALTGQTFSENIPDYFKGALVNILIYSRANCLHEMGIMLK